MAGTSLVRASDKRQLSESLKKATGTMTTFLGSQEEAERAMKGVYVLVQRTPDLQNCTVESIIVGMLQSAEFGLTLGREAYLVPFKDSAQFVPDWKGLVKLAIRTGAIDKAEVDLVYEQDVYEYERTSSGIHFNHRKPRLNAGRSSDDNVKAHRDLGCQGVYFQGIKNHETVVLKEMSVDEVEYVRKTFSKMPNSPLWTKRWSVGAGKTVTKAGMALLDTSGSQLERLVEIDNRVETGIATAVLAEDAEDVSAHVAEQSLAKMKAALGTSEEEILAEDAELVEE